jgi:hypothetical protein
VTDDEIERALEAIRKARAGDLSVPGFAHRLQEAALRAGATEEQVRAAIEHSPYWPEPSG